MSLMILTDWMQNALASKLDYFWQVGRYNYGIKAKMLHIKKRRGRNSVRCIYQTTKTMKSFIYNVLLFNL